MQILIRYFRIPIRESLLYSAICPMYTRIAMSSRWRKVLGIRQIRHEDVKLTGVNLFDGFLLGGQAIYQPADDKEKEERQDFPDHMPWYLLESGCKTYMVGMLADESVKNEQLPADTLAGNGRRCKSVCRERRLYGRLHRNRIFRCNDDGTASV